MSRVKRPYRSNDPRIPIGAGPQALGYLQTVQGKLAEIQRAVRGLRDRMRYRYDDGVPFSYVSEKTFTPEDQTFSMVAGRVGWPQTQDLPTTALNVQYVVRDGVTFEVPITLPGPGVFIARYLHVEFYQRVFGRQSVTYPGTEDGALVVNGNDYTNKVMWFQIPWGKSFYDPGNEMGVQTGKVHLLRFNELRSWGGDRSNTGVNLFWNLVDRDSERRFADDLLPGEMLLPQGYQNQQNGDLFEFKTPWLFERAGRVDFQFRLVNPILQLAPVTGAPEAIPNAQAITITGNGDNDKSTVVWDDLENGGLVRNQAVKVRVELHGTKCFNARDRLLREAV